MVFLSEAGEGTVVGQGRTRFGLAIKPQCTAVDLQSAEPPLMAGRALIYTSCDSDLGTGPEP